MATPIRVFISYSHESQEHSLRVLRLADRLRGDGVAAWIDRYTDSPAEGWPRWTQNQIDSADFVICVCTASYRRAFQGRNDPERGLGVNAEGYAILQDLYDRGNVSRKYVPVVFDYLSRKEIPSALRSFTYYEVPFQYDDMLQRIGGRSELPPGITWPGRPELLPAVNDGYTAQAEVSEYIRPESYPLERLAPSSGLFVSRIISGTGADATSTVWVACRGDLQYVLDSVRIYHDVQDSAGPIAEVAVPPDARYRFTYHDFSDEELALDPALSIGPQTRNMASFTVSITPDRPIYRIGTLWVSIGYHASDGRQGSVILSSPFQPGRLLAKLLGQEVLIATPAGRHVIRMVVGPDGLQRGAEEGHEPPLQVEFFQRLIGYKRGQLALPRSLEELQVTRLQCQDLIRRRQALHDELGIGDRLQELAGWFHQGEEWAADLLGGMATDAATALIDARLARYPGDEAAFHGLCIRHLARPDGKLAAFVTANCADLDSWSSVEEAAVVIILAPVGDLVTMFERLIEHAPVVLDSRSILPMLRDQLAADDWERLANDLGGPLGELYVRGTMHDWASPPPAEAKLRYTGKHRYHVSLMLHPGLVRFKIGDVWWGDTANWGGKEPGAAAMLGEDFMLNCNAMSHDITLDLSAEPASTHYLFELNATDTAHPTLTVSKAAQDPFSADSD